MVEYKELNSVFRSLADPTRRNILKRVSARTFSIQEIADVYQRQMSLAAISKHVQVLEKAKLIKKKRHGKQYFIEASPPQFHVVVQYLRQCEAIWNKRLDKFAAHLEKTRKIKNK